jgi:hypothetical protein
VSGRETRGVECRAVNVGEPGKDPDSLTIGKVDRVLVAQPLVDPEWVSPGIASERFILKGDVSPPVERLPPVARRTHHPTEPSTSSRMRSA